MSGAERNRNRENSLARKRRHIMHLVSKHCWSAAGLELPVPLFWGMLCSDQGSIIRMCANVHTVATDQAVGAGISSKRMAVHLHAFNAWNKVLCRCN